MIDLGLMTNTELLRTVQYRGFEFVGLCVFNGQILGAKDDGIFILEDGDTDDGVNIDAEIRTRYAGFDTNRMKRISMAQISGDLQGNLQVTAIVDDKDEETQTLTQGEEFVVDAEEFVYFNEDVSGRYVGLLIENVNGSDFTIKSIDVKVHPVIGDRDLSRTSMRSKNTRLKPTIDVEMSCL